MKKILISIITVVLLLPSCGYAQSTIRRGQVETKSKPTTGMSPSTRKTRNVSHKKPASNKTSAFIVNDNVNSKQNDDRKSMTARRMLNGFELYGKVLSEYTDNAEVQQVVRDGLNKSTNAKTGCLTDKSAMYIYGGNGYFTNGIPREMTETLQFCGDKKYVINDIVITSAGWWCVVYGGYNFRGIMPEKCTKTMQKLRSKKENILSISISDDGNYVIITDKYFEASNSADNNMIELAVDRFGKVKSACITNKGTIVVCEGGVAYMNVPKNIIDSLEKQDFSPNVIRYTDSGTFMAFGSNGRKAYYM